MKAIILARVSTSEQMEEGLSIPAQLAKSRDYCDKKGLEIKSEYCFDESSTKDQRKKFENVITEIKDSKEPLALVVETVDRLQRSFKESVILDEYRKSGKLDIHFIRENLVIHQRSNSSEIQRWDLAVFVAKSYVLQLSDNVRRSFDMKIKNGGWTSKAPVGYLNTVVGTTHTIIPDPDLSHYIRKAFELYASKKYSYQTLSLELTALGFRTKAAKPVASSQLERIIRNPFYYGVMIIKGVQYPHSYEPIINEQLYMDCQKVRESWNKKPFQYAGKFFILRGLVKCGVPDCHCMISPEQQDKYLYYACTDHRKVHKGIRPYVREEALVNAIAEKFRNLQLPKDQVQEIVNQIKKETESKSLFHEQALASLKTEYGKTQNRVENLLNLLLDNVIDKDNYESNLAKLKQRQQDLLNEMKEHTVADQNYYLTIAKVFEVANRAYDLFQSSEPEEKRQLIQFLVQNLVLTDRTLTIELKKPFCSIAELANISTPDKTKEPDISSDSIVWLLRSTLVEHIS